LFSLIRNLFKKSKKKFFSDKLAVAIASLNQSCNIPEKLNFISLL